MYKAYIPLLIGPLLLFVLSANVSALAADESQQIDALQRRAEKLSFEPLDSNSYHLAKARTWLDLALSEYYDKDDSGIVPASIAQAATLLNALENRRTGISMDTPAQIPGSAKVRPDLWDKIAALKKQGKFTCGQRHAAEAEVYLVWAGHEKSEEGWSHAEPYLRGAEDRIYSAQVAIKNCTGLSPIVEEKITLSTDVLFGFDKSALEPYAYPRLDELVKSIKKMDTLEKVVLVGHADRLRSDGRPERNTLLSVQRAESIRRYLIGKGIPSDKIRASGVGSAEPIIQCSTKMSKEKQEICLQQNRRVEITLRGRNTTGAGNVAADTTIHRFIITR
jgi:outer membrane protein OmpA-like peptidoglycan-associated protein